MFSALLPTLQQSYGLSESSLALLVGALAFSTSFAQPLFGALADRLGRRTVAALGVILSSVLLSLVPIAPTVYLLGGLLLAGGLGSAALHPSGATIARLDGGSRKELAVSIFGMGGTLGVALGPVLVLLVLSRTGTEFAPWLMLPGIVVGLLMLYVVPEQEEETRPAVRSRFWDGRLFLGPVGLLALAATLGSLASVSFIGAMPLWLVQVRGLEYDAALIGWTLASFSLAATLGGIVAGAFSRYLSRRWLVAGTLILAPLPLLMIFRLEIGTTAYFLAVMAAGALIHAGTPLLVVSAQDMAPQAVATASGMLMGFAAGTAGLLYIGVGQLQEVIGLGPAMSFTFLLPIPSAILAFYLLGRAKRSSVQEKAMPAEARALCLCAPCLVGGAATDLPIQAR
jgi:FSR family fosmidomycin resistance protein-like MFS transporter